MTTLDRSRLVDVFHEHFSASRSIHRAIDAVLDTIEGVTPISSLPPRAPRRPQAAPKKPREPRRLRAWSPDATATSEDILRAVARSHRLTVRQVLSGDRHRKPAQARHESIWLHRQIGKIYDRGIAKIHGLDNHTTAVLARRKIQRLVDADPAYGERLLALVASVVSDEKAAA